MNKVAFVLVVQKQGKIINFHSVFPFIRIIIIIILHLGEVERSYGRLCTSL